MWCSSFLTLSFFFFTGKIILNQEKTFHCLHPFICLIFFFLIDIFSWGKKKSVFQCTAVEINNMESDLTTSKRCLHYCFKAKRKDHNTYKHPTTERLNRLKPVAPGTFQHLNIKVTVLDDSLHRTLKRFYSKTDQNHCFMANQNYFSCSYSYICAAVWGKHIMWLDSAYNLTAVV